MQWEGIEWAIPLYQLVMVVLPIYRFVKLRRRVIANELTKQRALRRYVVSVILPVVCYALLYVGLATLEALTKAPLIPGEMARTFFILIGLGIAVWFLASIAFAVALMFAAGPVAQPRVK